MSTIKERFKGKNWLRLVQQLLVLKFNQDKEYELTIKEHSKRRSKDANAYFWEFLDKLAVKMRMGKIELYRELIRDIGGVSVQLFMLQEAVPQFRANWAARGQGWFCDVEPDRYNPLWATVTAYYGSSAYDTAQMSRLIDRLIWECNTVGIDTTDLKTKALLEVKGDN